MPGLGFRAWPEAPARSLFLLLWRNVNSADLQRFLADPPPSPALVPSFFVQRLVRWVSFIFNTKPPSIHTSLSLAHKNMAEDKQGGHFTAFEAGDIENDEQLHVIVGDPKALKDGSKSFTTPRNTPSKLKKRTPLSDLADKPSVATNGPLANGPRASPAPQGGPILPNGKPVSPYSERTNPLSPSAQIAAQTVSSRDPKAAAQAASDMRNVVRRKLTGYVGFANLPNQWHRKSVRKGFNFNVMVVGQCLALQMTL